MNKVILLGRLVADPETRYTQNNTAITRFKLAVNRQGKPQEGQPTADFFNITAWGKIGEFVQKYFTKGQQVLIEGYLRNNSYTDKNGNKRYSDDIHAEKVYFADSKRESGQAQQATQEPQNDGLYTLNEDDEDLPF